MYPPRPLFPPSDSDIALAEAGDKSAYERVMRQKRRVRQRQIEIEEWYRKNGVVSAVSPAKSDDDVSLHDDAGDDTGDDNAMDNAFSDDITDDIRYV